MNLSLRDPGSHGDAAARSACAEGQSVGGASAASALGSNRNECPPGSLAGSDAQERRRVRFGARAMLWQASTLKSVRMCGRVIRQDDSKGSGTSGAGVTVKRSYDGTSAGYGNLLTCGSVWACPRCAAVIASKRSKELGNAIRAAHAAGATCYLLTLTMRHHSRDALSELWSGLSAAWRKTFGVTAWTGDKGYVRKDGTLRPPRLGDAERFGVAGLCRAVEVTHGDNGWHLHAHVLVVTTNGLGIGLRDDYNEVLRKALGHDGATPDVLVDREWLGSAAFSWTVWRRWAKGLEKAGLEAPTSIGVDLRLINDGGEEVVGRYLSKATYDAAKKAGTEIAAGSITKQGKGNEKNESRNRTPFEILRSLAAGEQRRWKLIVDARVVAVVADREGVHLAERLTGEVKTIRPPGDWRLWAEYESASSGRAQLVWSRTRRDDESHRQRLWNVVLASRGDSAERSNEELADERQEGEVIVTISRNGWKSMLRSPAWLAELLDLVEANTSAAYGWLRDREIELIEPAHSSDARARAA
ncbi:hypothetical protein EB75_24950 [Mycobacterium sp. ST-F2]|nr:hypothetical protein EB75_24950 [Mycobacterium sp. ST-F2]